MTEQITSFRGQYNFLSNFRYSPFKAPVYNTTQPEFNFRTVEHYFQAAKAYFFPDALKIILSKSARHAKHLGSNLELVDNWDSIKIDVMLTGLRYKFAKPLFKEFLLRTEEAELIEGNTWNDRYWGMVQLNGANGPVWVGENNLGKLLMQVRKELRG